MVFDVDVPIDRLTAFDGDIYMAFDDGTHGIELWRSDGTSIGTERLTDINPGAGGSLINEPTVVGDSLFFRGDDAGATGIELWRVNADRTPPQTTIDSGPRKARRWVLIRQPSHSVRTNPVRLLPVCSMRERQKPVTAARLPTPA